MSDLNGKKIVIIGAGPTSIGHSGECDEGVIEACRALGKLGCQLILVNSNPDAIMSNGQWAAQTYTEPLTTESIKAVIDIEQPDALVPFFGGREGLHLASGLMADIASRYPAMAIWGPSISTLESIHNRETLQSALASIKLKTPSIFSVQGAEGAIEKARELGFPVVLRCDDPHQLPDGTLIYNQDELSETAASLSGETSAQMTIEASLVDWQQVEIEILRDKAGQAYLVGIMEYIDTAAVHPGDAIGVCPPQDLDASMRSRLLDDAMAIMAHLNIVGGATIRFAYHPLKDEPLVLAVHPRYTATSAMVARVYGLPLAQLSTLLAAGLTWGDLPAGIALPKNLPTDIDMVAVKYPHWDFHRLAGASDRLGPKMQATGQSLGCGANFSEAMQKALRASNFKEHGLVHAAMAFGQHRLDELLAITGTPCSRRLIVIFEALRRQASTDDITQKTHLSAWYVDQFKVLAEIARQLESKSLDQLPPDLLSRSKALGFSNPDIATLLKIPSDLLVEHLDKLGIQKNWDSLPGDKHHQFSTHSKPKRMPADSEGRKIIIIGHGAHEIGYAGELDYGIYHTAMSLTNLGYTPIIINSNAVSNARPDSSTLCYCEPLNPESILDIARREKAAGVITQFAGDKAYHLSVALESAGITIMGTLPSAMALIQDRTKFRGQIKSLGIPQPAAMPAESMAAVERAVEEMGYPLSLHTTDSSDQPSPVLINDATKMEDYFSDIQIDGDHPIWVEQFLEFAIEVQAEVLCDRKKAPTIAVLEHIELAGVHAGDSACVLPPYSIAPRHMETIKAYCSKVALALGICGSVNIRFAIYRDTVYLLEAICGASRNLGLVSRTTGFALVAAITKIVLDQPWDELPNPFPGQPHVGVRAPIFPFNVFSDVDPLLGPQMRATGQALAIDTDFGMAYFKAIAATTTPLPTHGTVLITVTDEDKSSILEPARIFHELGFKIMATKGTHQTLAENGIEATIVRKLGYGRPNLVDEIKNGRVQMVINTPTGGLSQVDDSVIRKAAIAYRVANITTPASALAAAKGIAAYRQANGNE